MTDTNKCKLHKTKKVYDEQSNKYVCIKCGNIELKKYHARRNLLQNDPILQKIKKEILGEFSI